MDKLPSFNVLEELDKFLSFQGSMYSKRLDRLLSFNGLEELDRFLSFNGLEELDKFLSF